MAQQEKNQSQGEAQGHRETSEHGEAPRAKAKRGFAAMDREKQRQIASAGGRASHAKGTGHEFTSEEAREAGRKGGMSSRGRRRSSEQQGR